MKWDYKTLKQPAKGFLGGKIEEAQLEMSMNALGSDGWELVTSFVTADVTKDAILLFKRELMK